MKNTFQTFVIPTYCLNMLVYGDPTGLTDDEINDIDQFISENKVTGIIGEISEAYFSHRNDVHNLGDNVVDIEISVSD